MSVAERGSATGPSPSEIARIAMRSERTSSLAASYSRMLLNHASRSEATIPPPSADAMTTSTVTIRASLLTAAAQDACDRVRDSCERVQVEATSECVLHLSSAALILLPPLERAL